MKKKVKKSEITQEERSFGKYILLGIVLLLIFLSYKIVEPYLLVLISSFVLAYLSRPVFNFLKPRFGKGISAFICMVLVLLILIIPSVLVISSLTSQASKVIEMTNIDSIVDEISSLPILEKINFDWDRATSQVSSFVFSLVGSMISKLPGLLVSGLIFLFAFFYTLMGWDSLTRQIKKFIPFKEKERVAGEINRATHGIVFGYLFVAILDFVVSSIGLYFAGIKAYFLLSFIVAMLVFVPGLGPSIVNFPLLVYLVMIKDWYAFVIVLATWFLIAFVVETIISSKILSGRAKIHPMIMLLGILGGTTLFGLFGFIIGPLILVYTIKLVRELVSKN